MTAWTKRLVPVLLLGALIGGLSWRHSRSTGPTAFEQAINRPMPPIDLASAQPAAARLTSADFATGEPQLINLFASWCGPCIAEAAQLATLKAEGVTIRGIAIRDRPEAVAAFLARHGNPYTAVGLDPDSRAQRAIGAEGVPETFVVDGNGTLMRRFIGGLDEAALPKVREALAEAATAKPPLPLHDVERHALFGTFTPAERWLILADSYARTGDGAGAVEAIRAGLHARPEDAELWTSLGATLVDQGRKLTPEAKAAFDKAIALAPKSPGPRYFLGVALARSGDRAGAVLEWRRLLASAPNDASWRPMVEQTIDRAERSPTIPLRGKGEEPTPPPRTANPRPPPPPDAGSSPQTH